MRHRGMVVVLLLVLMCPGAWGADGRLVHLDWQSGSSLVGLHGVGHEAVNEVRHGFEAGPCHRDLRLDLLYEPASTGKPDGSDPRIPYVFHAAVYDENGSLFSERSVSESRYGFRMGILPSAGTYEIMVRLDVGAKVDWDVRVRGFQAPDEPLCDLFLNEVETNPDGELGQQWFELYNQGDTPLEVSGWRLWGTVWQRVVDPTPFVVPNNTTVPAGGYLHLDLQDADYLADTNETVVFADPDGRPLDLSPPLTDTAGDTRSWSRVTDGAGTWTFGRATPGAENGT